MELFRTHFLKLAVLWLTADSVSSSALTFVDGVVKQNVLLQCPCKRELEIVKFSWNLKDVKIFSRNVSQMKEWFHEGYKNRLRSFLNENNGNCSLLLSDVSVADIGHYKCYFEYKNNNNNNNNILDYIDIYLNVTASYNVEIELVPWRTSGKVVYQCKASGGYPKSNIQWRLNGQPMNSTMEVHINNTTRLYNLTSRLTLEKPNGTELQCVEGNITKICIVGSNCTTIPNPTNSPQIAVATGVSVGVVMMLLLGVLLGLFILSNTRCRRQKHPMVFVFRKKQKDKERRDGETAVSLKADEDSV